MIVNANDALGKTTDVNKHLIYGMRISTETTGSYASWLYGKKERHNRIIQKMIITGRLESNQHENKCCCEAEKQTKVYRKKNTTS